MMQIAEMAGRLRRLAKRREDDGIYTDANLCEEVATHLEATGEAKPVCFIQSEVLAMLSTDKTATGTVCSGLLKAPFGNPVPLYAAPVPATPTQVAPDGKTKENGNHVSDSNLGEPLVDSRALDGRRVAVGADTLGDHGGDRLVHRPLAQSEQSSLVAGLPATDTARPLNSGEVEALDDHPDVIAFDAAVAAGRARIATRKPLDDDQIMEIIKEVAPWKDEPKLNDLLTYEKSPPLFPQATYDVPSYRAVRFVRAVEARLAALSSASSTPEGWRK